MQNARHESNFPDLFFGWSLQGSASVMPESRSTMCLPANDMDLPRAPVPSLCVLICKHFWCTVCGSFAVSLYDSQFVMTGSFFVIYFFWFARLTWFICLVFCKPFKSNCCDTCYWCRRCEPPPKAVDPTRQLITPLRWSVTVVGGAPCSDQPCRE